MCFPYKGILTGYYPKGSSLCGSMCVWGSLGYMNSYQELCPSEHSCTDIVLCVGIFTPYSLMWQILKIPVSKANAR